MMYHLLLERVLKWSKVLLTIWTNCLCQLKNLTPLPYNLRRRKEKAKSQEKPELMFKASLHHFIVHVVSSLALKMNLLFIWIKITNLLEIGTVCSQIVRSTSLQGKASGDMWLPSTWVVGSITACIVHLGEMRSTWWCPILKLFMDLDNPTNVRKQNSVLLYLTACLN